jgi:hypothetical protein
LALLQQIGGILLLWSGASTAADSPCGDSDSLMFIYKTCGKARAEGPLTDRATNLKAAAREI